MIALKSEEHLNKSFVLLRPRQWFTAKKVLTKAHDRENFVFDKHRITHVKFKQSAENPVKGKTFSCVFHSQMKNCDP